EILPLKYKVSWTHIVEVEKIADLNFSPPYHVIDNSHPKISLISFYSQHSIGVGHDQMQVPQEIANSNLEGTIFQQKNSLLIKSILPLDIGGSISLQVSTPKDRTQNTVLEKSLLVGPIIQSKAVVLNFLGIKATRAAIGLEKSLISNLSSATAATPATSANLSPFVCGNRSTSLMDTMVHRSKL
ncbi:MAG: hypothetical protein HQK53_15595, partial [Oligoflexia bacterium]|nr:hypothetical protein [Oligoflexia bacterium]